LDRPTILHNSKNKFDKLSDQIGSN